MHGRHERALRTFQSRKADASLGTIASLNKAPFMKRRATDFLQEIARQAEDLGWQHDAGAQTVIRLTKGDILHGKRAIAVAAKEFALLAFLALRASATDREDLVDALWPQAQPSDAFGALRVYVTKIRKRVGMHDIVVAQNNRYRLGDAVTTDLDQIRSLLFRAERTCDRATAVELVAAGESLLTGLPTFLADYPASSRLGYEVDQLIERTSLLLDRLCSADTPGIASVLLPLREALGNELSV